MPFKDREKYLEWHRNRQGRLKQYLADLKEKNPCADCGNFYPHYIMDFDHVRGVKIKNVSGYCNRSIGDKELEAEIAKCDVVCANCHKQRTWERNQNGHIHLKA